MKNYFILSLLGLFALGFSACSLLNNDGNSFISATVGDEDFETLSLVTSFTLIDSSLTIMGNTGGLDAQSITFQLINSYAGEGTYEFGNNINNVASYIEDVSTLVSYIATSGSLTISSVTDDLAEGTFNLIVENESDGVTEVLEISNGVFSIER